MKWVLLGAGGLAALIAIVALIGATLPRAHRASSSIVLRQSQDSIWAATRDLAGLITWWPALKASERLPDVQGRERWRQRGVSFDMTIEVTESSAPRRMVTLIVSPPGAAFGGTWTHEVMPADGGTRVTVTEDGWVANVIFRFVSRFVTGYHGTMDAYLTALGKHFGETVTPVHGA